MVVEGESRRVHPEEQAELWARFTPESLADSELWVLRNLNSLIEEKLREHLRRASEELQRRTPPDAAPVRDMDSFYEECSIHKSESDSLAVTLRAMLLYQAVGIIEQVLKGTCKSIETEFLKRDENSLQLVDLSGSLGVAKNIHYLRKVLPNPSAEFSASVEMMKNLNDLRNGVMHHGLELPEPKSAGQNHGR